MRDFLSEGFRGDNGSHLLAWSNVARPKDREGLGIRNLEQRKKLF